MRGVEPAEAEQRWVAAMMEQSGVRAKVQAIARGYADDALAHLGNLPPSLCRESIAGLVEFTLTRAS
jgi:geranylgeranyl pyrophosphate synthase